MYYMCKIQDERIKMRCVKLVLDLVVFLFMEHHPPSEAATSRVTAHPCCNVAELCMLTDELPD